MIRNIFKIIWTERKVNLWILLELILVFCILWFCVDFLYFVANRYFEPKGYDIENVYSINISAKDDGQINDSTTEERKDSLLNYFWTICDRIRLYPEIESLSVSMDASPYSSSYRSTGFKNDTITHSFRLKTVNPEYFDVFRMKLEEGKMFTFGDKKEVVISKNKDGRLHSGNVTLSDTLRNAYDENSVTLKIVGIVNPSKRSEFDEIRPVVHWALQKNDHNLINYINQTEINVRVKPEMDKDFAERFMKNMQEQLSVGPYFVSSVQSFEEVRSGYINEYNDELKSVYSITAFILINIFLAVVGTFWFRVQTRNSEIGLRLALGSSKAKVKNLFIYETLILLFIASIISVAICVNVTMVNVLQSIGLPSVNREWFPIETFQYFVNYGVTFLFLAVIAVVAVWYPAKKASDIQPAIALRDE